jgi:tRNA threonylcarbamoyladenosine biosynthesis protein TsaB
MQVLALETGSEWCSVAVGDGARWVVHEEHAGRTHSERILPMIDAALVEAGVTLHELGGIAFGAGPGGFTGVRIACGVAQGLALGAGIPVVPVSTLAALCEVARRTHGAPRVLAALDARMGEVYVAAHRFDAGRWSEVMPPAVLRPSAVMLPGAPGNADDPARWYAAGSGFATYPAMGTAHEFAGIDGALRPDAQAIGTLALPVLRAGEGVGAAFALPLYVRDRVALTSAERAAGIRL